MKPGLAHFFFAASLVNSVQRPNHYSVHASARKLRDTEAQRVKTSRQMRRYGAPMGIIKFRGGPFDGRTAPHDDGFPLRLAGLLYLPNPANLKLSPDALVSVQTCSYLHRDYGAYDFEVAREGSMNNFDYCVIKRIQDEEGRWLRALVTDPRLGGKSDRSQSTPDSLLPLEQARAKKEMALPRYRRWLRDEMGADDLSEEEAWEIFVVRTLGDLDWGAVGVTVHLESVRRLIRDMFDINVSLDRP